MAVLCAPFPSTWALDNTLNIKIVATDGSEVFFKIKKTTRLNKLKVSHAWLVYRNFPDFPSVVLLCCETSATSFCHHGPFLLSYQPIPCQLNSPINARLMQSPPSRLPMPTVWAPTPLRSGTSFHHGQETCSHPTFRLPLPYPMPHSHSLLFDGQRIMDEQTANDLEMEEGDSIEVLLEREYHPSIRLTHDR